MTKKAFGSGNFGEWVTDDFGLPAYRYTCDQRHETRAVTPVNPAWRAPTDHSHQVGNDRLVAVASNYGYVQVRQDEGGPKYLNDYDPQHGCYAGGFGYLTDGKHTLKTFYSEKSAAMERTFGIGYVRKAAHTEAYSADQVIFAPFGDDPLLISQVTVTNKTDQAADLRWVEYWGCQQNQFSHRAQVISVISKGKQSTPALRREFAARFAHHFQVVDGKAGLINTKKFLGYTAKAKRAWGLAQFLLATAARKTTGGALKPPVKKAWLEDLNPAPTFLVSLDAPADGFATDEGAFFGMGGVENPEGLKAPLASTLTGEGPGKALFLERRFSLAAGEKKTLYFAYGYLPQGFDLQTLVDRYRQVLPNLWRRSSEAWKLNRIQLEVPGEDWVGRELAWHHYYLRSCMTYDAFFQEHILSQGHVYQYIIGFQGAARDPLQHALPFVYCQPEIVKEVLRYTLKEVLPDGEIPYGVTGSGMRMAVPFRPSDQELWLLWLASEYVLARRDREFLDENLPTFPLYGAKAGRESVRNLLWCCFQHLTKVTGTGKHGLMRLSNGDWNDQSVVGFVPKEQHEDVRLRGESTLNAAFATYALDVYAQMLDYCGAPEQASEARQWAETQRKALSDQWSGQWFRRGWLNDKLGWIGEDEMWLEPQPWAIIGGAASPEQQGKLLQAINTLTRDPSPIGAMILSRSIEQINTPAGTATNGGVWPSINGTLVWALAKVDGELAWDEWKKNSLAYHAEAYPDIWYGIWSGPDTYNSTLAKYPGHTFFDEKALEGGASDSPLETSTNWTDFPVMNMHPHAWPLYDTLKLIGAAFTPDGIELSPALPQPAYRFAAPLLGLEKSESGYSGWYAPSKGGEWQISLHLPEAEGERFTRLEVNGQERPLGRNTRGDLCWRGASTPEEPLRWEIR